MKKPQGTGLAYMTLIIVFFCWGSVYVSNRYILNALTPLELACCRFLVAASALGSMLKIRGQKIQIQKGDLPVILLIGFLGYYLSMECTLISVKYAGASLGSLINSLNPVFITVFAAIFLKEKLTGKKVFCLVLALAGAVIVSGGGAAGGDTVQGVVWGIASILAWAGTVMVIRRLSARYDAMLLTFLGIAASLLFHIPTAGISLAMSGKPPVTALVFACILYSGIFGTAIPQFLWSFSLSRLPASTCSMFYPLMPVFSALLGVPLLGEKLGVRFFIGGALIISTVVFSCLGERKGIQPHAD